MQYYIFGQDLNGFTYSIDNIILEYIIKYKTDVITYLQSLNKKYQLQDEYWERLNVPYCSKYQYYNNHIHLCDGIYIMVGKYDTISDVSNLHDIFPMLKLEINPNKHANKPIFKELLNFLLLNTGDCSLKKYDLCIDIPKKLQDVQIFGSRKEKGLYKGTRYYGQRNKDGYTKIYDKGKEQGLEADLTRVEFTLCYEKGKHKKNGLNLEDIYILGSGEVKEDSRNDKFFGVLCKMYNLCTMNGLDPEHLLVDIDKRTRKKLYEKLSGYEYKKIEFDYDLHDRLIQKVIKEFGVVVQTKVFEDSQGFLKCDKIDLPFE